MKRIFSAISLVLSLAVSATLAADTVSIVSDASWKSSDEGPSGWENADFDDSSWAAARAPYPNPNDPPIIPGTTALYMWHDPDNLSDGSNGVTRAFFRRTFNLGAIAELGTAKINVDDDYDFYVNGELVEANHDGGFAELIQDVEFTDKLVVGNNVFALEAIDGSWPTDFDRLSEAVLFDASITLAEIGNVGPEFRVNTTTTDSQDSLSVAVDAGGGFVIAWRSLEQDGSGDGIYAQRYSADGRPQGGEFQVNTTTANSQSNPSATLDADGDFVIAWASFGQDGDASGIYAQRYSADGTPQGGEFRVNTTTANLQFNAAVALDADGDFVIAWESFEQDGDSGGIYAQRYSADGTPQGGEFRVNTTTANRQGDPSVAVDADGDFVIAWVATGNTFAQRYSADGTPQVDEFQVNSTTADAQALPSVAVDAAGNFVIAWQSFGQDGDLEGIYAQRYSADGTSRGGEFQVNTTTANNQNNPAVALDADGDFVIAWVSFLQDGDGRGIYAQRFAGAEDVDLSIVVNDDLDPVDPGGLLNYDFIVTNNHPIVTPTGVPAIDSAIGTSTGINTSHTLPAGVSLDGFSGNDWTCTQTARTARQVDCAFAATLLPTTATSADLTLSFDARAPAAADITTSVNVTGNQVDTDVTNNTDSETTSVVSPDTQPDPFNFDERTDVAPNTVVISNSITVTGIDAAAPIALLGVSGATYSIDGGPFSSEAGTIAAGSTVSVRQTSWSDFSTTTNATLVIGGITGTFSVTTAASLDSVTDEPDPITVIAIEDPSSPAAAAERTTTPGSSGGGCTLAGARATAGGLGWLELMSLLLFAVSRRRPRISGLG